MESLRTVLLRRPCEIKLFLTIAKGEKGDSEREEKIAKVEHELTNGGSDRKGREIHRDWSQRIAKQGTEVVNEWCCERKGGKESDGNDETGS